MPSTENDWLKGLGALVLAPVFIVSSALMRGWTITVLWKWFVVSSFHIQSLGIAQAIGLGMLVSFLTYTSKADLPKEKRSLGRTCVDAILETIVSPLLILGIAGIVRLWV